MKYCSNCGKQINENDKFCSECGATIDNPKNIETKKQVNVENNHQNIANRTKKNPLKGIGIALLLIGLVLGFFALVFISTEGAIIGYNYWDYDYTGGKYIGVWSAIIAVISLLIGICILISFNNNDND